MSYRTPPRSVSPPRARRANRQRYRPGKDNRYRDAGASRLTMVQRIKTFAGQIAARRPITPA